MKHSTLQLKPCSGIFEAHITVASVEIGGQDRFVKVCAQLDVKPILIELPKGDVAIQLMTSSIHRGEIKDTFQEVKRLAQKLEDHGFSVTRMKIEAAPTNSGIPLTSDEAASFPSDNYYEHHLKVLLAPGESMDELRKVCRQSQAHLSRNAFKKHPDGKSEQFITLRCYGDGLQEAEARFSSLISEVKIAGIEVLKQITEYCLFDDNISVDGNWENQREAEPQLAPGQ
jgi:effector-binding domain-containing protein